MRLLPPPSPEDAVVVSVMSLKDALGRMSTGKMCPGAEAATSLQHVGRTRDQRVEGPQLDLRMHCLRYRSLFRSPRTLVETSQCSERSRTSRRRLFMSKPTIDVYGLGVFFPIQRFFSQANGTQVFLSKRRCFPQPPGEVVCPSAPCVFAKHRCFSQTAGRFFSSAWVFFLIEDVFFPSIHFCCGISLGPPSLGPPSVGPPSLEKISFFFSFFPTLISFFFALSRCLSWIWNAE